MATGSSGTTLGVTAHYNDAVPIRLYREKIMVEISAPSTEKGKTAHLDLVVVLDTSSSMQGRKLGDMKQAAEFVIRKMGRLDRLTFVPFSDKARKPSSTPPMTMSDRGKQEASQFVNGLAAHGNTNIKDGLHTAVQILHSRSWDRTGRAAVVFLMSDGRQNVGDARDVDVHDFPVFTFGFGQDHDNLLLNDIARRSHGGTYNNTQQSAATNNLLHCFAMVLGILRDVSVMNLVVTLRPYAGATILEVHPGSYRVTTGHGAFAVHYGELARKEQRRIIAVIQLPAVLNNERKRTVMAVECSYRLPRERETRKSLPIDIARNQSARPLAPRGYFQAELTRREQAVRIVKMKQLADAENLEMAEDELSEAKNALSITIVESTQLTAYLLDVLSIELEQIEDLLESNEVYVRRGCAYMLASITSHERQRFVARGGDCEVMLFALPRMLKYKRQAEEFCRNPNARI